MIANGPSIHWFVNHPKSYRWAKKPQVLFVQYRHKVRDWTSVCFFSSSNELARWDQRGRPDVEHVMGERLYSHREFVEVCRGLVRPRRHK